jgi:hypothetical protein
VAFPYVLTSDHHAAEDLAQATLIKVSRRWRRVFLRGEGN